MRSRLASCAVLLALAASAVAAQQFTHAWLRLAPEDEEFAVHMPEPNFRIRRELPFGKGVTLKPASFEIAHRGVLFSVLSFSKSEPGASKSLDEFVKGFGHALSTGGARADLRSAGEVKLDGRAGRQFALKTGDGEGAARVFETEQHFYVVMTYGNAEAATASKHFHDSFSLDRADAERVPLNETAQALTSPVKSPSPLWPVAGSSGSIGVMVGNRDVGDRDIGAPSGPPVDLRGKTVISGGVLNGKVISKPPPVYPPIAKAARAQGTVTVQILVDEEGYVIAAHAVSGHPLLQQAAVFAARQVRFSPTLLMGQPVKVSGVITYNFVLG
ncbi:MAG TPA: energy transducer TonB [Pyrinomonadaceae bacterium]